MRKSAAGTSLGLFRDRVDAGSQLATYLEHYRGQDALVLGIPRGGVPVATEVARHIGAELNLVVARKVGAPDQPELAMGAVTANGGRFLNEDIIRELQITDALLEVAIEEEMAEARRREDRLRGRAPRPLVEGRVVIVVDDGLATGATAHAAVRSVRKQHPRKLVLAVPVGSSQACEALRPEVDELICVRVPEIFFAVGLHYIRFEPTEDAEVQQLVEAAYASPPPVSQRSG